MPYVDGYVLPVPKKNLGAYTRMAKLASKVWRDHGALEYREAAGDQMDVNFCMPFTRGLRTKPGETVVFAWIVFRSRAHRDRVNRQAMKDPRLAAMMDPKKMPFNPKRMLYGGFKVIVQA